MDRDRGRNGVDRCRRAAREAVADVEPPRLHDFIDARIDDASMTPGQLVVESAAAVDPDADPDAVASKAAAVQLVYEGLRTTRRLAREPPWERQAEPERLDPDAAGSDPDAPSPADIRADLEVVAADILVARGFSMLARTGAADQAVRTIRSFGRDQTLRHRTTADDTTGDVDIDPETLDANLERDILELAVIAGTAVADEDASPPASLLAAADAVVDARGTAMPPADDLDRWLEPPTPDQPPAEGTQPSDRATSATDP